MNPADICELCGLHLRLLLTLILHGICYRVCPGCLLTNRLSDFCPHCFDVFFTEPLLPRSRVICIKCPSVSHTTCAVTAAAAAATKPNPIQISRSYPHLPYHCPRCRSTNSESTDQTDDQTTTAFKFFDIRKNEMKIDKHLSKQLLAASKISKRILEEAHEKAINVAISKAKEALTKQMTATHAMHRIDELTMKIDDGDQVDLNNNKMIGDDSSRMNEEPEPELIQITDSEDEESPN